MGEVIRLKNAKRFPKPKTRTASITDPVNELNQTLRTEKIIGFGAFTIDKKRNITVYLGTEEVTFAADMFQGLRDLKLHMAKSLTTVLDD